MIIGRTLVSLCAVSLLALGAVQGCGSYASSDHSGSGAKDGGGSGGSAGAAGGMTSGGGTAGTSGTAGAGGGSAGAGGGIAGADGGPPAACSNTPTTPTVLATVPFADSLASDGTTLYVADNSGNLSAVPVTGGPLTMLASDPAALNNVPSVAVLDKVVYFAGAELIERLNPTTHAFDVLVKQGSGGLVADMTIGAGNVYWTNAFELGAQSAQTGSVNQLSVSSGEATALASHLEYPREIVADNTNVYWVDSLSSIQAMPLQGGAITTLVQKQKGIDGLAAGGGFVYWSNYSGQVGSCGSCPPPPPPKIGDGTLNRIPASGGNATVLSSSYAAGGVALDAKYVYWSDGSSVTAVPLDGGSDIVLAHEGAWIGPIVDDCRVYWVAANNSVKSIAKPH